MAFFTLDGTPIPFNARSFREEQPTLIGEQDRAYDGSSRLTVIGTKRAWSGETIPLDAATDAAVRALLDRAARTLSGDVIGGATLSVRAWLTARVYRYDGPSVQRYVLSIRTEEV
jgi:hypothetical protein